MTARGVATRFTGMSWPVISRFSRRIWIGWTVVATSVWRSILPASERRPYSRAEKPPPLPRRAASRGAAGGAEGVAAGLAGLREKAVLEAREAAALAEAGALQVDRDRAGQDEVE